MEKEFNLITEPWIQVVTRDSRMDERNLRDVLVESHKYMGLAGETPVQDVAILRLLLAVMQTIVYRYDEDGNEVLLEESEDALERWERIWKSGKLPGKEIDEYLEKWKEQFWLIHPDYPFYQVTKEEKEPKCKAFKLNGEISEGNHKIRLFSNRDGLKKEMMTYAEAARWLPHIIGFDDASAKTLSGAGVGYLGKLGIIYVAGDTLFETIMLNLVLMRGNECWMQPKPVWEEKMISVDGKREISIPDNQAELLTFQSRRLHMSHSDGYVTGYTIYGADYFKEEDAYVEQMTVWEMKEAKGKNTCHYFSKFKPNIQVWRTMSHIIPLNDGKTWKPGIVEWIDELKRNNCLEKQKVLRFNVLSVEYDSSNSSITDAFGDYLTLCPGILTEAGDKYNRLIQHEVGLCEQVSMCFFRLAVNLARASGNNSEDLKNKLDDLARTAGGNFKHSKIDDYKRDTIGRREMEEFYARIDIPFRKWLLEIDPEDNADIELLKKSWRKQVYSIAFRYAETLVDEAGESAFIGRKYKNVKENERYYSAPDAFNQFCYSLGKILEIKVIRVGENHEQGEYGQAICSFTPAPLGEW